jgi:hypothetical protein
MFRFERRNNAIFGVLQCVYQFEPRGIKQSCVPLVDCFKVLMPRALCAEISSKNCGSLRYFCLCSACQLMKLHTFYSLFYALLHEHFCAHLEGSGRSLHKIP